MSGMPRGGGKMKKESRDVFLVLVVAMVAMFALPVAYRVWTHCHPPPGRRPFADVLREAGGVRREALLATPPAKWTDSDAKLAPDVLEWLKEHSDVILPWEWSEEARRKDWQGFCGTWERVVVDEAAALDELIARKSAAAADAAEKAGVERKLAEEGLAAVAGVLSAATGAYPVCVSVQETTPGRLWGWNRGRRVLRFEDEGSLVAYAREAEERVRLGWAAAAESHERERAAAEAGVAELKTAREGLSAAEQEVAEAKKAGYSAGRLEGGPHRRLLDAVAAASRHRMPKGRGVPKWLPGRVRRWLDGADAPRPDAAR